MTKKKVISKKPAKKVAVLEETLEVIASDTMDRKRQSEQSENQSQQSG
ncbi:unnamed protein product [marine sediment metagenome]|uniref:Uncharacterized protein n=1 Tax=marine sediment metagenome TaxID=412755 RepID=X0WN59_9ZZZZ